MNDRKTLPEIHGGAFHTPDFIDKLSRFVEWYEEFEPHEAERLGGMEVISHTNGSEKLVFDDGSSITFEHDGTVSKISGEYATRAYRTFENCEAAAQWNEKQEIEGHKERVEAAKPPRKTRKSWKPEPGTAPEPDGDYDAFARYTDEDEDDHPERRARDALDRFQKQHENDRIDEPEIGLTTQESETMDMSERAERLREGKDPFPDSEDDPPEYHVLDGDVLAFVGSEPDQFIGLALDEPRLAVIYTGAEKPSNARKATEYLRNRAPDDDPRFVYIADSDGILPDEQQPPEHNATELTVNDVSRRGKCSFRTDDGAALAFSVDDGTLVLVEDGKTPDAFRALEAEQPEPDDEDIKDKADRLAELHVTKEEHESTSYEITDIRTEETEADDDAWRPQGYIAQDSTKNKLRRIIGNDQKTVHIALHPDDADGLGEPNSDSYRRARLDATDFEERNGILTNAEQFQFPEAEDEWGEITHISIYDGPLTEDAALVVTVPLDNPVHVPPGGIVTFAAYDIEFTLP